MSEKLGGYGRPNMLWPYLKIWDWDWIFGRAVKAISSLGVRSPWFGSLILFSNFNTNPCHLLHILFLWWFIFYSKHQSQNWSKFMCASPPSCKKWNTESHLLIDVLMNNDVICYYMISVHTKNITFSPLTSFC